MGLKLTVYALLNPKAFWPFLYMFLSTLPPNLFNIYTYVLLGIGNWSFSLYNANSFVANVIATIILIIGIKKLGESYPYNTITLLSQILSSIVLIMACTIVISGQYAPWEYSLFWGFLLILQNFASNLLFTAIVGRVSKYLPKGFESTGIEIVVSFFYLGSFTLGPYFSKPYVDYYNVKSGYYERLATPQVIISIVRVGFVLIAPLFLWRK